MNSPRRASVGAHLSPWWRCARLPVLEGYKATRCMRSELGLSVPNIALTSERQRDAQPTPAPREVPTPFARPWPEIDGIDSPDVSRRLCGDSVLFRSMLKRLLEEFGDVVVAEADVASARSQAGRMHKLKGSAGMLGASDIHRLAAAAEAACRAGDVVQAVAHSVALAAHLRRLKENAAAFLAEPAVRDELPNVVSTAVTDPHAVAELIKLLRQQSMSAMKKFVALSPGLEQLMETRAHKRLCDHVENLRFSDAAQLLDDARIV